MSSYCNICFHTALYVSSCYYMCVLILVHICPQSTMYVSSYYDICPYPAICLLVLDMQTATPRNIHLLCTYMYYVYICPHTAICVLIEVPPCRIRCYMVICVSACPICRLHRLATHLLYMCVSSSCCIGMFPGTAICVS